MTALKQVRGVAKALQTSMMTLLTNTVNNVSLKTLTILTKRSILNLRWLQNVPLQIAALKIKTEISIDVRQVKMELF